MNLPGIGLDKPKDGWSASGTLITGNPAQSISLQANFPHAETYVIEFSKAGNPLSNLPIHSEALITWSVEGNSVTRRVSIANGTTVQGVAQAVRVVIIDSTGEAVGNVPAPNGTEYTVSVQVTPGSRGSNKLPPFYIPRLNYFRLLTPVAPNVVLPVPQDAGIISFLVEAIGQSPLGFTPLKPGTLILNMIQNAVVINTVDAIESQIVPIVPGTEQIEMSMQPAFDPSLTAINFTLFYGIDG